MITVWCSDYLQRQELANDESARALIATLPKTPSYVTRLFGVFVPRIRREAQAAEGKRKALLARAAIHAREAEYWAKGRYGEDLLAETLSQQLGDDFTLMRNYTPPALSGAGGDIDAVLIGPLGIIVFEVKAWTGEYLARGRDWFWRAGRYGNWEPARSNPTSQALRNVERVKRTLQRAGQGRVTVRGVVAVANADMRVYLEPPLAVYLFYACQDNPDARSLWHPFNTAPLTQDEQRRVRAALLPHLASAMA